MKAISTFLLLATCFLQYLVLTAQTTFGPQQVIVQKDLSNETPPYDSDAVFLTDFDGDGDTDLIVGSRDKIIWYKNEGWGIFSARQIIAIPDKRTWFIYAADLDGDGDKDVIAATSPDFEAAWYENDGAGNFETKHILVGSGAGAFSVDAADLDGDGDVDFWFAYSYSHYRKVAWKANDGTGNFGSSIIISSGSNAYNASDLYAADVDDDGDTELLYSYVDNNYFPAKRELVLYENSGTGNFTHSQTVYSSNQAFSTSVYAADINNDGRTDIMSATGSNYTVAWYEKNSITNSYTQRIINTTTNYSNSVRAADFDNDGDLDIPISSWPGDDVILWYENDGMGNFSTPQIISTAANGAGVYVADLDGDGDLDVLSVFRDKIAWHKNLLINHATPAPKPYLYISPNPTQNTATLTYAAPQQVVQPATIYLHDLSGRLLFETTLQPTAGINYYQLDMSPYLHGLYLVTLNNGAEVVTGKVVRE